MFLLFFFTGPDDPRRVIVKSVSLVTDGRPDVTLDLTGMYLADCLSVLFLTRSGQTPVLPAKAFIGLFVYLQYSMYAPLYCTCCTICMLYIKVV